MAARFSTDYKKLGYFARTHGSEGMLLLMAEYPLTSFWRERPVIRYRDDRGDLVPVRLESVEDANAVKKNAFFVKLVGIDDRHRAESFKGRTVWMEESMLDGQQKRAGSVPYDGFEVVNEEGQSVGTVVNGFETAAQQVVEIELKDEKQIMVPLVEEFIVEVDEQNRRLTCRNIEILKDV